MYYTYEFKTQYEEMRSLDSELLDAIERSGVENGLAVIYSPHTTMGITINENADPDERRDILLGMKYISPERGEYYHLEGNSPAHIKTSLMGVSVTVFVEDGKPVLGTWQTPYACEFDGPRTRRVLIKIIKE